MNEVDSSYRDAAQPPAETLFALYLNDDELNFLLWMAGYLHGGKDTMDAAHQAFISVNHDQLLPKLISAKKHVEGSLAGLAVKARSICCLAQAEPVDGLKIKDLSAQIVNELSQLGKLPSADIFPEPQLARQRVLRATTTANAWVLDNWRITPTVKQLEALSLLLGERL